MPTGKSGVGWHRVALHAPSALQATVAVAVVATTVVVVLAAPAAGLASLTAVIAVVLLRFPVVYVVVAGVALPFSPAWALNVPALGTIALADIAAIGAVVALGLRGTARNGHAGAPKALRAVGPGLLLLTPYVLIAVSRALFTTIDLYSLATVLQRIELVVVWLILGALLVKNCLTKHFLAPFVAGSIFLAIAWVSSPGAGHIFGMQKNPTGGFIAAALVLVAVSSLRTLWKVPIALVLGLGLVFSGSRGSLVGFAVSAAILAVSVRQWRRLAAAFTALALSAWLALRLLPAIQLERLLGVSESARFNTDSRELFFQDAVYQWSQNANGVGVGNYRQVDSRLQWVRTLDPHNAYVLALVEGGIPLLIALSTLLGGSLLWVMRMWRAPGAPVALAVQAGILVHVIVDVYWVRGTPSIGWLLIGIAAMQFAMMKPDLSLTRRREVRAKSRGRLSLT